MADSGQCSSQPASSLSSLLRPGRVLMVLAVALVIWRLVTWWRSYARFRRLELAIPGPRSLPLLGSALEVAGIRKENALDRMLEVWGGRTTELSRFAIFNYLVVFATDPDHISKVIRDRRFKEKSWFIYSAMSGLLGQGLITASGGADWKRHRNFLQPAFHLENLEPYVGMFSKEAAALVHRLKALVGKDTEYFLEVNRALVDCLARTCMPSPASERDKTEFDEVIRNLPKVLSGVTVRILHPWLWPSIIFRWTTVGREQAKFNKLLSGLLGRLVDQIRSELVEAKSKEAPETKELLGVANRKTLLDAFYDDYLSPEEKFDEIKTIFGAALESTSTALGILFKVLSIRPDIQDRAYNEIQDVCGDEGRLITGADLARLEYTERVFQETLRMFPVAPFVGRRASEDVDLGGKIIPEGSTIVINILGMHRDPRHHPDPLHFDPDRFLPERMAGWHPYSYMPFGMGHRKCIGKPFAMLLMKSILAATLRAYRILPVDDGVKEPHQIHFSWNATTLAMDPTKIRFELRKSREKSPPL